MKCPSESAQSPPTCRDQWTSRVHRSQSDLQLDWLCSSRGHRHKPLSCSLFLHTKSISPSAWKSAVGVVRRWRILPLITVTGSRRWRGSITFPWLHEASFTWPVNRKDRSPLTGRPMTHRIKSYSERMRSAIPILPFPQRPYQPRQPPQSNNAQPHDNGFWSFSVCLRAPMTISTRATDTSDTRPLFVIRSERSGGKQWHQLRHCFTSLVIFQSAERHADKQLPFFSHEN